LTCKKTLRLQLRAAKIRIKVYAKRMFSMSRP
jgi:hypothetical protein